MSPTDFSKHENNISNKPKRKQIENVNEWTEKYTFKQTNKQTGKQKIANKQRNKYAKEQTQK